MTTDGEFTSEQLLLRPGEAAQVLGVSRTTVYGLIKHGDLRAVHILRSSRISWAELERFVARLEGDRSGDPRTGRVDRRWRRVLSTDGRRTLYPVSVADQRYDAGA